VDRGAGPHRPPLPRHNRSAPGPIKSPCCRGRRPIFSGTMWVSTSDFRLLLTRVPSRQLLQRYLVRVVEDGLRLEMAAYDDTRARASADSAAAPITHDMARFESGAPQVTTIALLRRIKPSLPSSLSYLSFSLSLPLSITCAGAGASRAAAASFVVDPHTMRWRCVHFVRPTRPGIPAHRPPLTGSSQPARCSFSLITPCTLFHRPVSPITPSAPMPGDH